MKIKYTSTILNLISLKHLITLAIWLLSSVFCLPSYAAGTWTATGSLATARNQHTATLLANGKLLVVGGYNNGTYTAENSAELYDPSIGTWSGAGSLATARGAHTANLLSTGKVLVVGGYDGSSNLNSANAELYTPSTGTWSSTASLPTTRCCHTATLLATGKVLVAGGGSSDDNPLASAVLYDPSTGTWSNTGSLVTARYFHTATLLPSGKVLVAGGGSSSAEVYDPSSGSWSSTGSMATVSKYHTATLLPSGKVLVAGGGSSSAEVYDPSSGSWSSTGSMATVSKYHTATLLPSGKVLVAGGWNSSSDNLSRAELYEPAVATAPAVSTEAPSLITVTSATLKGTVNPNGAVTTVTFDFGLTTSYGTSIAATPSQISATAAATVVTATKSSLTCNKLYHYRAKAVNSAGTSYGTDKSFTTATCPIIAPTAVTNAATGITNNTAILNGSVTPNGAATTVSFELGLTTAYGENITATPATIAATVAATVVTATKTGLICNKLYYYRVKAVNWSLCSRLCSNQRRTYAECALTQWHF